MQTHEIARQEWLRTFDDISAAHAGDRVSVEVLSSRAGAQPEVVEFPLARLSYDRRNGRSAVAITMARGNRRHLTQIIENLTRVFVDRGAAAGETVLQLEARDGTKTLVRLRPPELSHVRQRPRMVA
jgi:hypothetical protein